MDPGGGVFSKSAGLACCLVPGLCVLLSGAVAAQETSGEAEAQGRLLEEVVVTGTRIKRRDFTSPSPLTTIDRDAFEFSGQPTVEDFLNQLPQLQPDFGRTSNNPGDGTANLNLRALGAGRTLVLLNGRRLAPAGVGSAVDVNNLPRALIDRVEVITGGASAVYGSDAIAGVINFITREDFSGVSLESSYSVTEKGDAEVYDFNLAFGREVAGGRGNLTFYAGYYEREPLLASERELSRVVWSDTWAGELVQTGSPIGPAGVALRPRVDLGGGPVRMTWDTNGTPLAWDSSTDFYNFAPVNYLQAPLQRLAVGLFGTMNLTGGHEAYVEAAFTRNEVTRNAAPAPFRGSVLVNIDNPVLSAETRQVFAEQLVVEPGIAGMELSRRMLELGERISNNDRDYLRLVAGIRGEIASGWEYDAWVTWTDADEIELQRNDGSIARLLQGLLVDPATGECFDPSGGCVPLDVFGEGRLSDAGVDFLRVPPLESRTDRSQLLASVVVTGPMFDLPAGPLQTAFGAEWRHDDGDFRADPALFTGDTMGYRGSSAVKGSESVYELYAEALVPLLDAPPTGHRLGLELGARFSDYENAGSVWTWKAGVDWQPVDSLRFRAMLQRSVRAPNIGELFTEQVTEFGFFVTNNRTDPCSASQDPVGNGNRDKCVLQGLPPGQIGVFEAEPFYPVDFTLGGNAALEPESADTLTAGFVLTPASLPGLTVAIDYFDMEITDTIGEISATDICFDDLNTGGAFCDSIQRDESGNIQSILELISNRGLLATEGVDMQLNYHRDLPTAAALIGGDAQLDTTVYWTHLLTFDSQDNIVTDVLECAGLYGWPCDPLFLRAEFGVSFPENRVTTRVGYASGPLDIQLTWRWIDSMDNAAPLGSADFGFPDPDLAVPRVSAHSYFDLGLGYRLTDTVMARFGINNLFDKDPPLLADAVSSSINTDSRLYDVFGRTYFLSIAWMPGR